MSRRRQSEPTHEMVQFIGWSKREVDIFCSLTEKYNIGLRDFSTKLSEEITRQMNDTEVDHEHLLETIDARSRSGVRLTSETNLLWAIHEWKRDVWADDDRLTWCEAHGARVPLAELMEMHRRAIGWMWFWSIRAPVIADRPRFAQMALAREAALQRSLAKRRSPPLAPEGDLQ
jgi:hypothetical protein